MGDLMIDDGFDKDDFDSTLARFASKGQKFVHDVSKLKRKVEEPVILTSATDALGGTVLSGLASSLSNQHKNIDDKKFRKNREWLWYSWERREDFE